MPIGNVRRSQLITTYGVGSIVPVKGEAVMVAGIHRWAVKPEDEIHEPRLEKKLGVERFILPPSTGKNGDNDVPAVRFPSWYWCPTCKRLDYFDTLCGGSHGKCNNCGVPLVPSRFVIVCENGHIDDFPYFEWVHAKKSWDDQISHELSIKSGGVSASLSDVIIRCSCGLSRSMEGSFNKMALKEITRCTGNRPWLGDRERCDQLPRTLQRGASNVYFPVTESAISIPPWSEGAYKIINRYWSVLRNVPENALFETIQGMGLASETPYETEDLVVAVKRRKAGDPLEDSSVEETLKPKEYEALSVGKKETSLDQDFVCEPTEAVPVKLEEWIDQVMLVKRLREVRVLTSFVRSTPPSPADDPGRRAPISKKPLNWLPGMEVMGEGVFIRLNSDRLIKWETNAAVTQRTAKINTNYDAKFRVFKRTPDRVITPRLIMIHTLAHAVIIQWSMDCGYPAASLRERLYVSDTMAGLLIYTASTDAAGSLGGIISLAKPKQLDEALHNAIEKVSWCSADPLCIESDAAGVDSLNLAACHACILLPEVSCEEANSLLDRGLLVGTRDKPDMGFFSSFVP